jgi:predicted outer membrane repeat protein
MFLASAVGAADHNVPGDYGTIQEAINAAAPGDVVVVADGTYAGPGNRDLDFGGKAITVRSENGPANCIIDCQQLGRGFYFHSAEDVNSVVEGFTITNGKVLDFGGAIECSGASPTISNCIITGNMAPDGGAIDCWNAAPTIIDCVITDNTAAFFGGAIEFYDCRPQAPAVTNCLFTGNSAGDLGGAIDSYNSTPTIRMCTMLHNTDAAASGGVYADSLSQVTIVSSILWFNTGDLDTVTGANPFILGYCCIEDGDTGVGNMADYPRFRTGPLGDYYLSQAEAGQLGGDSPCVDTGFGFASGFTGPNRFTTRTDGEIDIGRTDIGYHYPQSTLVRYELITAIVAGPNSLGAIEANCPSPDIDGWYKEFSDVLITADPCDGYKVKEWTVDSNTLMDPNNPGAFYTAGIHTLTIDSNTTVMVEFEPLDVYQLTTLVAAGIGGTIQPAGGPRLEGEVVTLSATPDPGFAIRAWTGTNDDNSIDPNNYVTMTSDKTVTVEFAPGSVTLTSHVIGGNGTVSPRRAVYGLDAVANLTATPDPGYRVKSWTGTDNDVSTGNTNTVTMTENKDVFVEFEPVIWFVRPGVGTIQGAINQAGNFEKVIVFPGTYHETEIDFHGKRITVQSVDPQDPATVASTIIDCENAGRAFIFQSGEQPDSLLTGFTIINGRIEGPRGADASVKGLPVYSYDPADPNDPNFYFVYADSGADAHGDGRGGAIFCAGSSPTISYCVIRNCTVTGGIGGNGADGADGPWVNPDAVTATETATAAQYTSKTAAAPLFQTALLLTM